jgi:hypothetical protein
MSASLRWSRRSFDSRVRESINNFTKGLRKLAKESASLPSADGDDRKILGDTAELLALSVNSLVKIIKVHDALVSWTFDVYPQIRPEQQAALNGLGPHIVNGIADLSSALRAAFNIWRSHSRKSHYEEGGKGVGRNKHRIR